MAGPIGGNFNIPGQKNVSAHRNPAGPSKGNHEAEAPGDLVSISGAPTPPQADKQDRLTGSADPASAPSGFEVAVRSEKPSVSHAPDRILMGGVQQIGGYTPPADGSGVTGLNSIASVVSSGTFQGLNGTYGQRSPFGF